MSKSNRRLAKRAMSTAYYTLLILLAVVFLFPYVFMVMRSFMSGKEVVYLPVKFFPTKFVLDGYKALFLNGNYLRYTLNTLAIVGFNIVAIPLAASLVAYGFAKMKFKGKNILFAAMLSTMMLPGVVVQIPLYVLFSGLGWLETPFPMMIPNLLGGGAVNIFLFRQFMRSLPKELDEASKLDGANAFRRYLMITLPLCKPIIIFVMVGVFNTYWSDFYGPLLYLKKDSSYTLAIGIFNDAVNSNNSATVAHIRMAAGTFMTIVPACIYFVFQRQLIEGVVMTGIK